MSRYVTWDEKQHRVWGVINQDGSVTSKGRIGDEHAEEDQEVYPPGSLAWYCEDGWYVMATGRRVSGPPEKPKPLSEQQLRERRELREAQRRHPGQIVCVLCRRVPCACRRCPKCGMTEQDRYGGCPRGCGKPKKPVEQPRSPSTPPATNAGGATTGAGGGAGVSHASEGNAQLQQAAQNGESAQGAVQQVIDELQQMLQNFLAAAEESQHPEADTVSGQITQAISQAEELQQFIGATKAATEAVKL